MIATFQRITGVVGCLVVFGATLMLRGIFPDELEAYAIHLAAIGGLLVPLGTLMILFDQRARALRRGRVVQHGESTQKRAWRRLAAASQAIKPAVPLVNTVVWMLAALIIAFVQPPLVLSVTILTVAYLSAWA